MDRRDDRGAASPNPACGDQPINGEPGERPYPAAGFLRRI